MYENVLIEDLVLKYVEANNQEALINLLSYCFGFEKQERLIQDIDSEGSFVQRTFTPNINDTYQWMLMHHIEPVLKVGGLPLMTALIIILEELAIERPHEVNYISSIEPSNQKNGFWGDWSYSLIDFVTKCGELVVPEDREKLLAVFFNKNKTIFLRIAFHLVRVSFEENAHWFWEYVSKQKLDASLPIHELYLLIKEHSPKFSDADFKRILDWINGMTIKKDYLSEEHLENSRVYRIRCYLDAIVPANTFQETQLKEVKSQLEKTNEYPLEHPEFDSYTSVTNGYDIPENATDLESKTVGEIVETLNHHEDKDNFDTTGPGLALLLNNFIINNPGKYLAALPLILSVKPRFLKQVIDSFTSIIKNGDLNDWKHVLQAILTRVNEGDFKTEDTIRHTSQTIWELSDLLLELSKKFDKYQYTRDDLDFFINTVIDILDRSEYYEDEKIDNDVTSYLLNSTVGKLMESLVNFGRRWAQTFPTEQQRQIQPSILEYFDHYFNGKKGFKQGLSIAFGSHFWFFLYAGKDWCDANAELIFPKNNEMNRSNVLRGLFSPYQHIYQSVLAYFKKHNLNGQAINTFAADGTPLRLICKYALVEYFEIDKSALTDSSCLLNNLIANGNVVQLKKVISLCMDLRPVQSELVVNLWAHLLEIFKHDEKEYQELPKLLPQLSGLLPDFDERSLKLINDSIPFLDFEQPTYIVCRALIKNSSINIDRIAQVLLKVWQQTNIRVHVDKELEQFIETLYIKGFSTLADDLCIYIGDTGEMGLKKIYDNYKLEQFTK